ncbi:MAG: hypothetical protein E6G56_02990 [Actinobacteria bacterium]|nr:MAG: hypothetical protein E6G56_02990 [Actinomycetota bacterium]
MGIGTSIFLIAVGAILRWAVSWSLSGVSLQTVGLILLIVGVLGLIISLVFLAPWSERWGPRRGTSPRDPYVQP